MLKEVKLELTEQCERMCIHCSSKAKREDAIQIPLEVAKRVIQEAHELGATSLVLTGGEATLYPELERVVSYAHQKGMQVKLYTMISPQEESIEKIQNLSFYGLSSLIYSTTYRLTRDGVVTYEKLATFFPKLLEKTDISLGFHHVVTKDTLSDIDDAISLFLSLPENRTTHFSLLRYVPHGRGDASLLLTREETLQLRDKLASLKKRYPEKIRLGSPWNYLGISHTPCTAATDTMIVGFDGSVYPCDAMKYFDYLGSGGNIYTNSLSEIYSSSYFLKVRESKEDASFECLQCAQFPCCKGGCLGQKMVSFVDTDSLDFTSYGNQALRTMREFESLAVQRQNGELGLLGELGEFLDSFKKYKTHHVDEDSKEKLRANLKIEAGDILWYLAASLGNSYGLSFAEVGDYLSSTTSKKRVGESFFTACVKEKDPECLFSKKEREVPLSILDAFIKENYDFDTEWKKLVSLACELLYQTKKEEVLKRISTFLISLATIVSYELSISMTEVAKSNLEKLKTRYTMGFDSTIASSRVTLLTDYKKEEVPQEKPYQKHI